MSTIYKKRSKLPVNIWVDDIGNNQSIEHNIPKIKVQNNESDKVQDDTFVLSIEKNPKILAGECKLKSNQLKEIEKFIINNYDLLIQHWNQEIDTDDLKDIIYK